MSLSNSDKKVSQLSSAQFQCQICMKSFHEDYQLSFHARWIHQVIKHVCGGCQSEFLHSVDFSDHLLRNQCKTKDKNLNRQLEKLKKKAVLDSLVSFHLRNRYVCQCLKAFSNKITFRKHVKSDHKWSLKDRSKGRNRGLKMAPDPDQVGKKLKVAEKDGNVIKQEDCPTNELPKLILKRRGLKWKLFNEDSSPALKEESPDYKVFNTLQNKIQIDKSFAIEFEIKEETPDCDWQYSRNTFQQCIGKFKSEVKM